MEREVSGEVSGSLPGIKVVSTSLYILRAIFGLRTGREYGFGKM